jgi:fucose permease
MLTMPIAGRLTDRIGPGKLVLSGIVLIAGGMTVFTQVTAESSYVLLLGGLFVLGLGMGMTMMPIMSAAMASLTHQQVARGSTTMNIVQQTAGSIGTAVMSVILTNRVLDSPAATAYTAVTQGAVPADQVPPAVLAQGQSALADAFGYTYVVAVVLIVLCIAPALFLPRKRIERAADPLAQDAVPVGAIH